MMTDRTVHAFGDTGEVVRYERAGKWYFELPDDLNDPEPRELLTLDQAVAKAVWLERYDSGRIIYNQPGGRLFDKRVWRAR